jgi:hypothetical protein
VTSGVESSALSAAGTWIVRKGIDHSNNKAVRGDSVTLSHRSDAMSMTSTAIDPIIFEKA